MEALKFIWQLPQIIIAFVYYLYLKFNNDILDTCSYQEAIVFIKKKSKGSVTLGNIIFLSPKATEKTIKHEWGHTRQSLVLGPLYLIIIGIPSIIWASIHKKIAPNKSYYWFFTEASANKLGGL